MDIIEDEQLDHIYGPVSVPWKNFNEWLEVYKKAYSAKHSDQMYAHRKMMDWQEIKSGCPLGVTSTCIMLQGVVKDKVFHPEIHDSLADEDLQIIYGGSIMRFLNFIGLNEVERVLSDDYRGVDSMYSKAQKIGIPDWVVNIRHEVSHGTVLPEIGLLRICIAYILKSLKNWYWEIEEKELKEIVLKRPRKETLMEYFIELLNIYRLVKQQQIEGIENCKNVINLSVREKICSLENFRLRSEQLQNAPWELNLKKNKQKGCLTEQELKKYSLSKIGVIIIKYIKEYNEASAIDIWSIIVKQVLHDSINYRSIRLNIWGSLIKGLSDLGFVRKLLDPFMLYAFKDTSDFDTTFWAKKWLTVLLQALLKRSKVEKLKLVLTGKMKKGKWERKILSSFNSDEIDRLKEQIIRSEKNVSKQKKMEVYNTLGDVIEEHDHWMRCKLKLSCNPLDPSAIGEYLMRSCEKPNEFTPIAIDFFIDMSDNKSTKLRKSFKKIVNIYQGKEVISGESHPKRLLTLSDLLNELDMAEDDFSDEDLGNVSKDVDQHSGQEGSKRLEMIVEGVIESPSSSKMSVWPSFLNLPWDISS